MKFFIVCLVLIALVSAAPLEQHTETDPELTAGYFEGDIVLNTSGRNGLSNKYFRWPNNTVYYKIADKYFDQQHLDHIHRGMKTIEDASCIRFMEANAETQGFVLISGEPEGCSSNIGYFGTEQFINLEIYPIDEGCFRLGTIAHELLHTLGFYHMQSDSHRDDYVNIVYANIQEGAEGNFKKLNDSEDYGQEYDYGSVLHYPTHAFSKNYKDTIVPIRELPQGVVIGQRAGMSQKDIIKLNSMYKCPVHN